MKIQEAIKQSKFKDERHKLVLNILYTSNWMQVKHSRALRPYKITVEQYNILRILRGQHPNPSTINLLIDRMLNKMSNASRLVEKLRQKGLVVRSTNESDRRACDVLITEKGLALLKEMDVVEQVWINEFQHIAEQDAILANNVLDKMRNINSK